MKAPFYRCTACRHDFTVTAGTLFGDTRLPLTLWFEAMWYVVNQKHGASALGVQRVLGVSYPTAWRWLHKLRRAMVRPGRDRLTGTVEVDEVYIGGERPGKRGRGAAGKALVLVAAQADGPQIGRIRLGRVANASQSVLTTAVGQNGRIPIPGADGRLGWVCWVEGGRLRPASGAQRRGGRSEPAAARQPGGQPAATLAAGHTSRGGGAFASGLLSGRVCLSLQSPPISFTRIALLPLDRAIPGRRSGALPPIGWRHATTRYGAGGTMLIAL